MDLIVRINMDNDAFLDPDTRNGRGREAARLLHELATRITREGLAKDSTFRIMDGNGNTVGKAEVTS